MIDTCIRHPGTSDAQFRAAVKFLFDSKYFGRGGSWPVFPAPIAFDGERWQFIH